MRKNIFVRFAVKLLKIGWPTQTIWLDACQSTQNGLNLMAGFVQEKLHAFQTLYLQQQTISNKQTGKGKIPPPSPQQ